jgi:hypothetical protein
LLSHTITSLLGCPSVSISSWPLNNMIQYCQISLNEQVFLGLVFVPIG